MGAALGMTGCAAHVQLRAPGVDAPEAERGQAYETLKPISRQDALTVSRNGQVLQQAPEFLQLADGQRVYYPEDLTSVVEPDSPTAVAARQSQSARGVRDILAGVGVAVGAVGFGIALAGFAEMPTHPSALGLPAPWESGYDAAKSRYDAAVADYEAQLGAKRTQTYVGLGGVLVGAVVTTLSLYLAGRSVADAMSTAFDTYDKSLRQRLRLTGDQQQAPVLPTGRTQVMLDQQLLELGARARAR